LRLGACLGLGKRWCMGVSGPAVQNPLPLSISSSSSSSPSPHIRPRDTHAQALALEEAGREWSAAKDETLVQWEEDETARAQLSRAIPALEAWQAACFEDSGGYEVGPKAKAKAKGGGGGGKGKGKAAAGGGKKADGGRGGKGKRKASVSDEEEDEEEEEEGGGGSKKKKKAKKARLTADDEEGAEVNEWGESMGGGGGGGEDAMEEVRGLVESGEIHKCTVPQLKEHCRALGLQVGGKKADLVARLEQAVEEA
jgi:hypothetical protein